MIRIYYRVSTEKQDFDMQKHNLEVLCKNKGIQYDECVIYQDFGISGTTADRASYQKLLAEVLEGDTIIVYEFSRLWRDMEEQSRATKMLLALGVSILSVSDGELNKSTKLLANIRGSINEYEAERTRERINAGIKAKNERVALGLDTWNQRGKDKKPRSKDGYFKRWEKYRNEVKN
jgi:DNA invertase Pin-like site-specific DNA recombinase